MSCSCPSREFPTIAAMSAAGPLLADGALVTTAGPRAARWTLSKSSSLSPDGIRVIAAQGGGVWLRDLITGAPGAASVSAWFVASNGDDNADGLDVTSPVAHLDEVLARIGAQTVDGAQTPVVVISLDTSYVDAADKLIALHLANGATVVIFGTRVMAATATITAVTPWDDGTATIGSYTLSADLSAYLGRFMRVVSGPNQGLRSPIAKALGGNTFRGLWMNPNTYAVGEPAIGDIVEVLSIPKLSGNVRIQAIGDGTIGFQDVEVGVVGADHSVRALEAGVTFLSCIVHGLDFYEGVTLGIVAGCVTYDCRAYAEVQTFGSLHLSGGGAYLAARGNGVIQVVDRTLIQGGPLQVGHLDEGPGHVLSLPLSFLTGQGPGTLAVADYAGDAMIVTPGSTVTAQALVYARDALVPGSGNGYRVLSGGSVFYAPSPALPPQLVGSLPANPYFIAGQSMSSLPPGGYADATTGARMAPIA